MQQNYHFDQFDRSTGNGSRATEADWLDEQSIFDNQWGSTADTTFNPNDTDAYGDPIPDAKRDKLKDLYDWHHGKGEQTRATDILHSHIRNDAETFMSVLEMPDPQRRRVLSILESLDISSNNFGRRYEKIILALCSLVADEALSNQPNPSLDERLFLTDDFRNLMDCTRMSSSELNKLRADIRDECDEF